jgi:hypothetical protein
LAADAKKQSRETMREKPALAPRKPMTQQDIGFLFFTHLHPASKTKEQFRRGAWVSKDQVQKNLHGEHETL